MPMLHDPAVRCGLESRLTALRADCPRKWGSMTPDQMLWHVNQFLAFALGEETPERRKSRVPLPIFRFLVLNMPWIKGAPTHPTAVAKVSHDFEAERARCLALIDRFVRRPVDGPCRSRACRSRGLCFMIVMGSNAESLMRRTVLLLGAAVSITLAAAVVLADDTAVVMRSCEPIDGMPIAGFVPGALEKERAKGDWRIDPDIVIWTSACK